MTENVGSDVGFPTAFHCEHAASKSRVFALVHSDNYQPSLHAVLTCRSPQLAELASTLLSEALEHGAGPVLQDVADRVRAALPDAPAASFREALQRSYNGTWPLTATTHVTWEEVESGFGYEQSDDQPVTPGLRDSEQRTPSEARLKDLAGTVIRTITLHEVHVHDPDRLVAGAKAQGWMPIDEFEETDPDNLIDAVMHLGDSDSMPGADLVTQESEGCILTAKAGHEVADWSPEPITANFGTGWRLRHNPRS